MQNHVPVNAITPTEFNELLDEEFDNGFEIRRSPFIRKIPLNRTHYIRCDEMTWDEFEVSEANAA